MLSYDVIDRSIGHVDHARRKHPGFVKSRFSLACVLLEEVGEFLWAVFRGDKKEAREEALDVVAVLFRYIEGDMLEVAGQRRQKGKAFALALALALVAFFSASAAFAWRGEVVKVHDGDTLSVKREYSDDVEKIRLYGIDAPELKQKFGVKSKEFLDDFCLEDSVIVVEMGKDKYGRTIAIVLIEETGAIMQEELLQAGLAWVYPAYCLDCRQWYGLQVDAKRIRAGLWVEQKPVQPWLFRRGCKDEE